MAAGPSYFCRHKSNQKGFQQKGFFAALGLYPANQVKPRAAKCCPTIRSPNPTLQQLLLCPFLRSEPTLFYLISPEAVLLTLKQK
jgi:hypothetical protein